MSGRNKSEKKRQHDEKRSNRKHLRRSFIKAITMEVREHKSSFIVYCILRIFVVASIIWQLINHNYENAFLCVWTLLLLVVPSMFQVTFKVELPSALEITILCFIFAAEMLGEISEFYVKFPFWDTALHTLNGFLAAAIGFSLIDLLNQHKTAKINMSPFYLSITAFCFSMTVGVIWEFFEFAMDYFFSFDMQKDTVVNTINSVMLDPAGGQKVVSIKGINEVIINGNELGLGGYLDIGLYDTMKDMFVNFIGAVVFSAIGFYYVKNRSRKQLVESLIPQKKDESADFFKIALDEELSGEKTDTEADTAADINADTGAAETET